MKNNGYEKYLPNKKTEESFKSVQARLTEDLHEKIVPVLEKNGWTWNEFLNGLILKFLDDNKKEK